jgi:small subunit ribosomal protein S30e
MISTSKGGEREKLLKSKEMWMRADSPSLQVEPQEKKKTPKGRAKKRITYTRRFVNVTMTGGKRKVRNISRSLKLETAC